MFAGLFVFLALLFAGVNSDVTRFRDASVLRVEMRFREGNANNHCALDVEDVRSIRAKRTPHDWHSVSADAVAAWHRESITVVDAVTSSVPQDFSPTAPLTADRHNVQRMVSFTRNGEVFAYAFTDPRYLRHHTGHHVREVATMLEKVRRVFRASPQDSSPTIEAHSVLSTAVDAFWIPSDVDTLSFHCGKYAANVTTVSLAGVERRSFAAQATTAGVAPEVHTLYNAGPPDTQFNIVFNSGGYRAQDHDMFINNVTAIAQLLNDPSLDLRNTQDSDTDITTMHRSVPLNRYLSSWNIYAVFQPSVDVGANRPLIGLSVNNNLGCTHPAQLERAVYCDQALSFSLASASPADVYGDPDRVVVINIVNTAIYGGSAISVPGRYHMGNFFNGYDLSDTLQRKNMLSLVDHETGHAIGSLFDEYSIGLSQPSDPGLQNCQIANGDGTAPTNLKWSYWLTLQQSSAWSLYSSVMPSSWGVLQVPEAVCGYSNFYKPNANCMMHRLNDYFMCPVCREMSLKSIFRVHFSLAWPRYPLPDVVTVIGPAVAANPSDPPALNVTGQLVLHLPAHLTRGFKLQAFDADGSLLPFLNTKACMNCIVLNGTNFAKYPPDTVMTIHVNITDNTDYFFSPSLVSQYSSQLNQNTTFRLVVASSISLWAAKKNLTLTAGAVHDTVGSHPADLVSAWTYCEGETPNATLFCSMAFPNRTYAPPQPYPSFLTQYDGWILIVLGGIAFFFLILWGWAVTAYTDTANGRVRPIFKTEFTCIIGLVRRIMQFSAVAFLLASVATVGLAAYYYFQATSLGKIALIAGVVMAVILYLLAFIGYWAIASRSKRMLILNGGCLFIALAVMATAFFIVIAIGQELQVETSINVGGINDALGVNSTTQNGYWTNQIQSLWEYEVAHDPTTACSLEDMLQCTGFYTNCGGQYPSTLVCPTGCDDVNAKWQSPCLAVFKDYVVSNYVYIAGITGGAGGLLLGGFALNCILFGGLVYMKRRIQAANQARITKKIKDIHGENHCGGDGSHGTTSGGAHHAPEVDRMKALYLLKSLDSTSTESLIREFKRIDKDGNGELDRKELVTFFTKCLYYKPTAGEIEEIYRVADRDGDGTISLVEFLKLFGAKDAEEAAAMASRVASPRRAPRAIGLTQMQKFGSTLNSKLKGVRGRGPEGEPTTPTSRRPSEEPVLAAPMLATHDVVPNQSPTVEDLMLGPAEPHMQRDSAVAPHYQHPQQQHTRSAINYDDLL